MQFATGHFHAIQVAKTQPEKMASFEALWQTEKGAPMSLFGFPDEAEKKTHFEIAVPKLLSLMIDFRTDSEIKGLKEYKKDEKPPLFITYMSYHVMIWLGSLFALLAAIGAFLLFRKKLFETRWYLTALIFSIPLPLLANEVGWISAEVGRQPWAVYKILRTADAASKVVPAEQILFTIIMFTIIYIILFVFFIKFLKNLVEQGPDKISSDGY
jgi:cytochrome d ubiquinol oxidase subunit I